MSGDIELSKFLSFVLRHDPGSIGLMLDTNGWTELADLVARANAAGRSFTRDDVLRLVANSDKQRFTLSPDQTRIRAAQGHSVAVDLALTPMTPPDLLYHGTADRFLDAILAEGLRAQSRQHVHLSADIETAAAVGRRHGRPVVLVVRAAAMHREGRAFHRADNGVWLTDAVPPEYLERSPD